MTNSAENTAHDDKPAKPRSQTALHVTDVLLTVLLSTGLVLLDFGIGLLSLIGMAMSGDACGSGASCAEQDSASGAAFAAAFFVACSLAVCVGGIVVSARKRVITVWAPLAGAALAGLACMIVFNAG
ncbi:hypothetical protein [Flexivirga oryzae]|uniref:Uncharacterized protein n=1 Tax=Flexivirga oryzae TaxID=1794944 RepID=A0A839N8Y7_9MICO|nr:hypothetical protein [Flexivirga oryzae]MBB2892464.1 hypothetical protein [Flexivirga oryzae]